MPPKEDERVQEILSALDLPSLPPDLANLVEKLNAEQLVVLQTYLEVHNHNHLHDFPLHLTLEALEKLKPGFGKESLDEALQDAKDERKRLNSAQTHEMFGKSGALLAGWCLVAFGAWKGTDILSRPALTVGELIAGCAVLACCIGGPVAIALFMRNSGVKFGVQSKLEDD